MSDNQKRLHAIVRGRVQGVSFRHYTTLKAHEIGVMGWVYNRLDEAVEVLAEGTESQLADFLQFLQRGSPHAQVKSVDVVWSEATGEFSRFETRYGLE